MTAHVGKSMGWRRSSVGKITSETYTSNPGERDSVIKKKKKKKKHTKNIKKNTKKGRVICDPN